MLKLPRGRLGKEASTYWAFAGCVFPEERFGCALEFHRDGARIVAEEGAVYLKKGLNLIQLPAPRLTNVCLHVTPSVELLTNSGVTSVQGGGLYSEASLQGGLFLKIMCKEDTSVSSLCHYYLLGGI
jgi:hypothetical protein